MPRPRSDDKRSAILAAATRVIVLQGLSAPTAGIAKEAGVASGSLFTYFETKTELFNALYVELKLEMASAAVVGLRDTDEPHDQFLRLWENWTNWAVSFPEKREALAQLGVAGEITAMSRAAASKGTTHVAELMEKIHASGPMRKSPILFVMSLMNAVVESTIEFMIQNPTQAKQHCKAGFEGLWRMIT